MARFMRGLSLVGFATLCSALLGSPASACDTRHFYNHSNFVWAITLSGGATCSIGRVNKATRCVVPPGQTADLHYPDFLANWGGRVGVGRDGSVVQSFSYDVSCNLKNHGNTGNVSFNDPADGDVQTCGRRTGGGYDCR